MKPRARRAGVLATAALLGASTVAAAAEAGSLGGIWEPVVPGVPQDRGIQEVGASGRSSSASDFDAELEESFGITYTSIDPGSLEVPPVVSREEAAKRARAEISSIVGSTPASTPELVLFTDSDLGRDVNEDGTPEVVDYQDQPAWMIVFEGASVPILGGAPEDDPPDTYTATVVVFIDTAAGGRFLEAVTV